MSVDVSARHYARVLATTTLPGSTTRGIAAVALFTAVQFADGVLTMAGVARFGLTVESNPLLSFGMTAVGAGMTLSIAKAIAVLLATMLHGLRCHLVLVLLTIFYVFAALIPWASLLG